MLISRDEYKQANLQAEYSTKPWAGLLRWILADVRDERRMNRVLGGVDYVIHAAALKRVGSMAYNPDEAVSTNVIGTWNVARACVDGKVKRAAFLSTDKAAYPVNTYGRTKAVAEDLWRSFNFHRPIFTVTRYGNVMASRGSVVEVYRKLLAKGITEFPVTDPNVTRFWMTPEYACEMAVGALQDTPGVTLVAMSKAFLLGDLVAVMGGETRISGLPAHEKQAETILTKYEAGRTVAAKRWLRMAPDVSYDDRLNYNPDRAPTLYPADLDSTTDIMSREELRVALEAL